MVPQNAIYTLELLPLNWQICVTLVVEEDQPGNLSVWPNRKVASACEPPCLIGTVPLNCDLHEALGAIVQKAQRDHAAAAVGHIVVSVDFFPAAQHLPFPLKHDAVLGKEISDAGRGPFGVDLPDVLFSNLTR